MLDQDKILHFIKTSGPTLPARVAKDIKTNILLASAHLSDLASRNKLKISHLKIGGSPLYYLAGQEADLYKFAQDNINPKDQQVLERLREEKVLREAELPLLAKVSLRSLKDFAIPLRVRIGENSELFWKWHLLSAEETNELIAAILTGRKEETTAGKEEATVGEEETTKEEVSVLEKIGLTAAETRFVEESGTKTKGELREGVEITEEKESKPEIPELAKEKKKEIAVKETSKRNHDRKESWEKLVKKEQKKKKQKIKEIRDVEEIKETKEIKGIKREEKQDHQKIKTDKDIVHDNFLFLVNSFFEKLEIIVEEEEVIRKHSEVNLVVKVPSVIGETTYFCKAKNKIRCDEKDLSSAYMEAQIKKLPLLFLYKKEMTKKVQEMLKTDAFQNAIIKKIKEENH